MDWFERLTGFREADYHSTRQRLAVDGDRLRSLANGRSWGVGDFRLASLRELRDAAEPSPRGRIAVRSVVGDVYGLHHDGNYDGALFQVASQFNCLEMTGPGVTPEDGVTPYQRDPTQGPACAIAAGAATIYRNYFVPVGTGIGQTRDRQLDALADMGALLASALGRPAGSLWQMSNGYALCREGELAAIADHIRRADAGAVDVLRAALRIGFHRDVEVTGEDMFPPQTVAQAFCSALPVSYSSVHGPVWAPFATLVLEAAYEATLWAGVANARRGTSNIVVLTRLGGGAFGNDDAWIDAAILRALRLVRGCDLDVRMVSYGREHPSSDRIEAAFA